MKYILVHYSLSMIFGALLMFIMTQLCGMDDWKEWLIFLGIVVIWAIYITWRDEYIITHKIDEAIKIFKGRISSDERS